MRYIPIKLFSLLFFCLLFSCSEKEEDSLELSTNEITLNKSANYGSFMVIASGNWSIEVPQSGQWCTVTPRQGQGRMEVKIKGEPNESLTFRETTLNIISGETSRSVRVVQPGSDISVTTEPVIFPATGGSRTTSIKTNTDVEWTITPPPTEEGITVSPLSGKGSKDITITLGANPTNQKREIALTITANGKKGTIPLEQEAGDNHAPNDFLLVSPADNTTDVSRVVEFKWQATTDPDGDPVSYKVEYSTDNATWTLLTETSQIKWRANFALPAGTKFYWRVVASDDKGASKNSPTWTFTTNNKEMPLDGSYSRYSGGTTPLNGSIPILFIGDGFTATDYEDGGLFDRKADEGIEDFFATEPFKSYRENFKVYKVVAYSEESGASRWDDSKKDYITKKNTAFDTRYYGNGYTSTTMTANCDKVYEYAKKVEGITEAILQNTTVVLIVNDEVYSGTCWMSTDGKSVSIVPTCGEGQPYSYKETMAHEAGGHGFGRLADEYVFSDGHAPQDAINNIINWSNLGANPNIDVTGDPGKVKWKHFFGTAGYASVSCVEGAQYRGGGVWMPENSSAMRDMTNLYYNAPSREAIVKRIKKNLGQTYQFSDFINKDKGQQRSSTYKLSATRSGYVSQPTAHTPPQLYIPKR